MITIDEATEELVELNHEQKSIATQLLGQLRPVQQDQVIVADSQVFPDTKYSDFLLHLRQGHLQYIVNHRQLFHFDNGDLIGIEHFLGAGEALIQTDFAVTVDLYSADDFTRLAHSDEGFRSLLLKYLCLWSEIRDRLLAIHVKDVVNNERPALRVFDPGSSIITQGDHGSEVFSLLEGRADAWVDGVKVGEIGPDEMFGVLAAFAKVPRTATVTAVTQCLVLALPEQQFRALMERRPETVLKLIHDMSRTIIGLNTKLVAVSKQASTEEMFR